MTLVPGIKMRQVLKSTISTQQVDVLYLTTRHIHMVLLQLTIELTIQMPKNLYTFQQLLYHFIDGLKELDNNLKATK